MPWLSPAIHLWYMVNLRASFGRGNLHAGIQDLDSSRRRAASEPPQIAAFAADRGDRRDGDGQRGGAGAEHVAARRLADDRRNGGSPGGAAVRAPVARREADPA